MIAIDSRDPRAARPRVALVAGPRGSGSGIGRYVEELAARLPARADLRVVHQRHLPAIAGRPGFMPHFPVGFTESTADSIAHFPRIMGCAQMVWRSARPAVATVHDLGPLVCPEDQLLFNRFDRMVLNMQLRGLIRMDRWIVNSDQTRDDLVRLLGIPASRIDFVQLGVDADRYRPIAEADGRMASKFGLGKRPDVVDILYVGNEQPRKGLRYLIEALARLKGDGCQFRFLKAGGPGGQCWRDELKRQIDEHGLTSQTRLLGHVDEEDLPAVYSFADIYVIPTLLEGGFTWTAMEAMACGVPVIATSSALIRPEAQHAAAIVPPRDANALHDVLGRLIACPEARQQLAARSRDAVLPFTWDATIDALLQVYQRLMPSLTAPSSVTVRAHV